MQSHTPKKNYNKNKIPAQNPEIKTPKPIKARKQNLKWESEAWILKVPYLFEENPPGEKEDSFFLLIYEQGLL